MSQGKTLGPGALCHRARGPPQNLSFQAGDAEMGYTRLLQAFQLGESSSRQAKGKGKLQLGASRVWTEKYVKETLLLFRFCQFLV